MIQHVVSTLQYYLHTAQWSLSCSVNVLFHSTISLIQHRLHTAQWSLSGSVNILFHSMISLIQYYLQTAQWSLSKTFDHWSVAVYTVTIHLLSYHILFCCKHVSFCAAMVLLNSYFVNHIVL